MPESPSPAETAELLTQHSGGVARITINRPERRNAMSWGVMTALRAALAAAKADPEAKVVVLTGAGDAAFCAGADLGAMGGGVHGAGDGVGDGFLATHEARGVLADVFDDLWHLGKPTIARVQGWALAGGMGLALACDLVLASERARFGAPEINVGLWPYMITVPLLSASSISNRFFPGTQPSATAFSHDDPSPPFLTPTTMLSPLSRMFSACPRPCVPYPSMHNTSLLNISLYF